MSNAKSAARPKREAEDFARSHENTSKKPRFDYRNPSTLAADAPEEDIILDADVIGKSGTNTKRNAVNIDGYESDSDNDNFDARAREKAKKKDSEAKSKDEDDDDMFADLEEDLQPDGDDDEELGKEGKGKGKDVRFLDQSEIEGQVMNSEAGGHVSADILMGGKGKRPARDEESESSGDEEERDQLPEEMDEEDAAELGAGSKKKHAPRLDAYNLKNEEEEGKFDESGNFVRKAQDPDAVNDNWLEGLSKKDMKKAKEAEEKREEERRRKAMQDDAVLTSDVLSNLIAQLDTGETPLEALQRLGKGKTTEKKVPKWKQKKQQKRSDGMEVDEPEANGNGSVDPKEEARREAVDAITGAADALYSRGQHEIYQAEREILMRQYRRETGEDWKPAAAETVTGADDGNSSGAADAWEYRWSDARDGGSAHGPYDSATMHAWNEAGYFGSEVEFRRTRPSAEWSRVLDIS
ncbi:putative CD2 antigen cytoplasmic tail-binding protein 2/Lin1 [Septoria linicola]|nr:putative CD2 antigen cytoplasmic tail-binding protein 2/Lin1 [Septoria linicola]